MNDSWKLAELIIIEHLSQSKTTLVSYEIFKYSVSRVASSTGMYWGYWDILGVFLVLGFVLGILEIAKLYWDVLGKFYFDKEKIFI